MVTVTATMTGRRRLTQGELDLMVAAHERFLGGKPGGKRASLRFMNLSGLDLCGRNLSDADLSASVLDGTRLIRANIRRGSWPSRRSSDKSKSLGKPQVMFPKISELKQAGFPGGIWSACETT